MLNKDLTDSCRVFLEYAKIEQAKERDKLESEFRQEPIHQREVQTRSQGSLLLIHGGGENFGNEIESGAHIYMEMYTNVTRKLFYR